MWLPHRLYESLPYLYVIIGALLNVGTLYVGLDAPWAPYYVGAGVLCTLFGLAVFYRRQVRRRNASSVDTNETGNR